MASIDVVLVNYGCAQDTITAVGQLQDWRFGRVWVIDNSAHDAKWSDQSALLQACCVSKPWARMLDSGGNVGFGQACNMAFRESDAEFVLLLNPDARIAPDDILALAEVMAQDQRLGALSPAVYWNEEHSFVLPMPSTQTPTALWGAALRTHLPWLARYLARRAVRRTQAQMTQKVQIPAAFLAGAIMLLRRSAVLDAGGLFDPAYFMFFEDADLSLRLRRKGYRLAIAPQFRAVHEYRHKSFKEDLMAQSHQHYLARNFPRFDRGGNGLAQVQRCHHPIQATRWFKVLPGPLTSAAEFAAQTCQQGVLAWSPSLLMEPAVCRPAANTVRTFSDAEWALLEPGTYVALLANASADPAPRWVRFEKS